jgi:hypothetical protein
VVHQGRATQSRWVVTLQVEVKSDQKNGGALPAACCGDTLGSGPMAHSLPRLSSHKGATTGDPLSCSLIVSLRWLALWLARSLTRSHPAPGFCAPVFIWPSVPWLPHSVTCWFHPLRVRLKNLLLIEFRRVQYSVFWLCFLLLIFSCL